MRVDANSSAVNAVALRNSEHARLSEIRIDNPGQYGLGLSAVTHSEFTDVAVVNSGLTALTLVDSNDNRLSGLRIYDATRIGLMLESSSRNVIMDTVVANIHTYEAAEGHGVHVRSGSRDNMLSRLFVASAGGIGVLSQGATAQPNTLLAVTIVNTASCGLHTVDGGESTLANIFIANAEAGICVGATSTITGNTQLTFANVAVSFAQDGVRLANAVDNRFTYALSIGNSTNLCEVGGASSSAPGLIDATCSDTGGDASSTYAGQASDATLYLRDYGASLSGNVAGSTATYASITDWSAVNTAWRFWGRDGAELSPAQRGACDAGATCRLFDAAVRASDTALRNVNGAFTAGAICPASVAGDVALEDASGNVFLINAIEDAGDGDGLCESAEACLFSPNIGAYQGAGSRTEPCVFADGRVSDVTLRAYATNGH